ncbi:amidohydrolase [Caldanaerobacter subterraneus subsp. tengcongensis MB4]|nr:M20/M25/M40 family metallo-hydrolase [Caldanaerobacter subterraneus]MCS3916718.1 amidohydrolase [Caldanaerobacter subterraneus subsp. tengcongensis MB4]
MREEIEKVIEEARDRVVEWRRYFHQYPELSFHEVKTAEKISEILSSFGNLEISRPVQNSVVADLKGAGEGKTLAIRSDIDALPIKEENEFEFSSKNPGVMHACGHDGHIEL